MARAKGRDARQPWIKFYTRDWRADAPLRMCSYAARGLWVDLITLMAESPVFGFLLVEGVVPTCRQLAGLLGGTEREITKLRAELAAAGVFSVTGPGEDMPDDVRELIPADMPPAVLFSRRMVRDKAKAERDHNNGKGGGNPNLLAMDNAPLNGGVNPQANPQSQSQSPEEDSDPKGSDAGPASPQDQLFKIWLPWLMARSGRPRNSCASQIGKWRKAFADDLALLAAFERCKDDGPQEPMAWMEGAVRAHRTREPGDKTVREMLAEIDASGVYDGVDI